MLNQVHQGDCLEVMKLIPDGSADMILCDLPYAETDNGWDELIPFERMWAEYWRILKPSGAIVLTADGKFGVKLAASQLKHFRYRWVWDKVRGSNFQNARRQPMKSVEDVLVFYRKQPTYNPQFWYGKPYTRKARPRARKIEGINGGSVSEMGAATVSEDGRRYPLSILSFPRDGQRIHPTQKPVALFEYLIKTYTNPGETVLDNCLGSGTTAIAAINTGRNWIGIEREPKYVEISQKRINDHLARLDGGLFA